MPDTQAQIIHRITGSQAALLRRENALAGQIVRAYENARRELLARFSDQFGRLGDNPTPEQIRQLANDASLIRAIDQRLADLQTDLLRIINPGLTDISTAAFEQAAQEVLLLAEALGVNFFQFGIDPMLELTIGPALDQVPGLMSTISSQITATMREMLASGDRFSDIVRAIYGQNEGVFARGRTSAELMIRRAVIQANNNSRLLYFEEAKKQIGGLQKQAIAAVGTDTTETCLKVHGQIQDLDKPFHVVGRPSFGEWQMSPPFHWNCRTTVAPYHPVFERTSSQSTPDLQAAARAELRNRAVAR